MESYFSLITPTQKATLSRLISDIPKINEGLWYEEYLIRNITNDYILRKVDENKSAEGDMYCGKKKAYFNDKHVQVAVKKFKDFSEHSKVSMFITNL